MTTLTPRQERLIAEIYERVSNWANRYAPGDLTTLSIRWRHELLASKLVEEDMSDAEAAQLAAEDRAIRVEEGA